jgi:uncharacterized protein (DUF2132 family)
VVPANYLYLILRIIFGMARDFTLKLTMKTVIHDQELQPIKKLPLVDGLNKPDQDDVL